MTTKEYLLTCLGEECNEVAQRVSKSLRFGLQEVQTGQYETNEQRLIGEMADLCGVFELLVENGIIDVKKTEVGDELMNRKKEKIAKYLQYSKNLGIVQDPMVGYNDARNR